MWICNDIAQLRCLRQQVAGPKSTFLVHGRTKSEQQAIERLRPDIPLGIG